MVVALDKKEFLCRYHNLIERIEKKKHYIAFCEERAKSIPGQDFSVERVDHTPSYEAPFVKWVLRALDEKAELKVLEEAAVKAKEEIESAILTINDEVLQKVLVYRYIDWYTWNEICSMIYCSLATVKRKHENALKALKIDQNS